MRNICNGSSIEQLCSSDSKMNIEVLGRIRPPLKGETASHIFTASNKIPELSDDLTSSWYDDKVSNEDLYEDCVVPMVDLFLTGYNLSFVCLGEAQSGRSFTLFGSRAHGKKGVVAMVLQALVEKINQNTEASNVTVDLKMYEVYSEVIRDLLHRTTHPGELGCNAHDWYHAKNVTKMRLQEDRDALDAIMNGWKLSSQPDNTNRCSTLIVQLEATVNMDQFGFPHRSFLTLVDLPAFDHFSADMTEATKKDALPADKSVAALQRVVETLHKQRNPSQEVDYSSSKVTCLLEDTFGGNAKTKVMVHFKPSSSEEKVQRLLKFASKLTHVTNYFIMNDAGSQGLLTGLRGRILNLQRQLGAQAIEPPRTGGRSELSSKDEEISKLKMENNYLARKLDRLQNQFSDVAVAKEDLSSRLIASEEERLRASRALVDFRIESTRQMDRLVQENFELKNKLMSYESQLLQEQSERRRAMNNISHTQHKYQGLDQERRDLIDRYTELQNRYEALIKKHDLEVRRNQELGLELMNLLNAEVTLIKQQGNLRSSESEGLRKVRDIALGLSAERDKVEGTEDQDRVRQGVDKMQSVYDQQQDILHAQIQELNAITQKSKRQALDAQKRLAQQEVELMLRRDEAKEMERDINNLNLQIKAKNEELRRRLQKYLDDIADFVEQKSDVPNAGQILKGTVDQITGDMKKTYQNREKQLSDAARSYRQQAQKVAKKHEQLLVAYRILKDQVDYLRAAKDIPEEHELSLSDAELESKNRQELNKLGESLKKVKEELEISKKDRVKDISLDLLKKQFQEQQEETERERASLLASNALLEEQLAECSLYINKEIPRYKDEIQRLRLKLGITDPYMLP